MLVGRRPNNIEYLDAAYEAPPPAHTLNQSLTPEMSRVLAWPLNRYASDRPSSAGQFVEALRDAHHQSMVNAWKLPNFLVAAASQPPWLSSCAPLPGNWMDARGPARSTTA